MTVKLFADPTHKAVVFSYTQSVIDGDTINIEATNTATGDVGSRESFNTGTFTLFYPFGFEGEDKIVVTGSDGGTCSGTVSIK